MTTTYLYLLKYTYYNFWNVTISMSSDPISIYRIFKQIKLESAQIFLKEKKQYSIIRFLIKIITFEKYYEEKNTHYRLFIFGID